MMPRKSEYDIAKVKAENATAKGKAENVTAKAKAVNVTAKVKQLLCGYYIILESPYFALNCFIFLYYVET